MIVKLGLLLIDKMISSSNFFKKTLFTIDSD